MELNMIQFVKDLMNVQGVDAQLHKYPYENIQSFDEGFRQKVYEDYKYSDIIQHLECACQDNTIYLVTDQFEVDYVIFKVPFGISESDIAQFVTIGPYLLDNHDARITEIIEKNQMPLYYISELMEFYCGIPILGEENVLKEMTNLMAGYIFGGNDKFVINRTGINFSPSLNSISYRIELENTLSMATIEERYGYEDKMLSTIERGDYNKLMLDINALKKYRLQPRTEDPVRDSKNLMIVLNTLCRKAVQKAEVHPAHIDSVSRHFAKRIEASGTSSSVTKIGDEMMRKYCLLVRNYSLRGYSLTIQKVINYIDFNLTEPLSLKYLAEKALVSPNHLSMQFKKETGKTLTNYINQKRIQSSLFLLATTDLPIQSIAEKVGIYDENYFSRLFKRIQNKTAREYRSIVKSTEQR